MPEVAGHLSKSRQRRFRPYPAYKDSGVEWLGSIPAHWSAKRLKFLAPARNSKLEAKPNDTIYVGLEHVESGTGRLLLETQPESVDSVVSSFAAGDVLLGKLRPYLAKAARPDFDGVCTSEILPLRPIHGCSQSYLMYWLLNASLVNWLVSLTYGAKMPRVNPGQVGNSHAPAPPESEQHAIAEFLDRETAKIDALVAKKERLIELLQEKRTALITRAVTRGLDPNVPMKDSGIAWLGEIPAHWEVMRIKSLSPFVTSGSRGWAEFYSDEGPLFLRIGNVQSESVDLDLGEIQHVDPPRGAEGERTRVRPGDVLVSITALIGAIAVVPRDLPEAFVNQHLALVRFGNSGVDSRWIAYCIMSPVGQQQFAADLYGGTKDGLGLNDVRSLIVLAPPTREQERIVRHLDQQTKKLTDLVQVVRTAIDHLNEYRTALISAAVTGKIDVRNEAA